MNSSELISTGIQGLDSILLGGVRQGNMILVEGAPGAGKTTLGLEFIYRGVTEFNEPGLIITFELTPQKLLRDAHGFGWKLEELEQNNKIKIIYTSPSVIIEELQSSDGLLMNEISRIGVRRVLIDGLTPLRLYGESNRDRPFRETLHLLLETLQRHEVTAMLTREVPASIEASAAEFSHEQFVCDTIFTLSLQPRGRYSTRQIEITKSRGQDFISGKHTLRIEGSKGVRVYQRAEARPLRIPEQPTSTQRTSLGVPAVDEMIGSGIFDGSVTLVVGVTGTGKTVLGTEFLVEGARQGKKGLLVTLDEHPAQIIRNAEGLGLDLKKYIDTGMLQIHFDSPQELEPDVHFHKVTQLVEAHDIQRIVIDSLTAYRINHANQRDFHDFIYALTTYFKDRLVTAFLNYESPEMLGLSQISEDLRASTIVDNIILLNYVEISNRLRRAITVPKARGSAPTRQTYEYTIQPGGITLLPTGAEPDSATEVVPQLPFASYYGVLARSPARVSPVIEESIVSGKELPETEIPLEEDLIEQNLNGGNHS